MSSPQSPSQNQSQAPIKNLCVFCGSSNRTISKYGGLAEDLGQELAARQIRLIYGGAAVGLMGVLADTVMAGGGEVHGFIPEDMAARSQFSGADREVAHSGITKLELVDGMHARKQRMYESADAFCALPGGIGTLEELSEVYTWNGLGYHGKIKPLVFLDDGSYWNHIWDFLDHMVAEKFLRPEWRAWAGRAGSPTEALKFLSNF